VDMLPRFFLPVACGLALAACSRPSPSAPGASGPAVNVQTSPVAAERIPLVTEVPAAVHPAERAVIAARLTGTISALPWGLGQPVRTGDLLLALSAPEAEARVRQAQAQLAEAERAAERERTLVEKGVNPADSLRAAEDRLHYAQAALAEAEAMLAYATVRAPFDGVITEKQVLPGDLATPGLPLLTIESTQHLRAEGTIPEQLAVGLRLGDTLNVLVDESAPPVAGRIEEISAAADVVSRSVLAKVALPPGTARSGQFVRLQVAVGETTALLVPAAAVSRFGQMERVFVVENGRAELRLVKTGRTLGVRVEILAGVNPGERVVLSPSAALRDGSPVTVQP
jgi:membrane fusion protein (multidrug efflux system)